MKTDRSAMPKEGRARKRVKFHPLGQTVRPVNRYSFSAWFNGKNRYQRSIQFFDEVSSLEGCNTEILRALTPPEFTPLQEFGLDGDYDNEFAVSIARFVQRLNDIKVENPGRADTSLLVTIFGIYLKILREPAKTVESKTEFVQGFINAFRRLTDTFNDDWRPSDLSILLLSDGQIMEVVVGASENPEATRGKIAALLRKFPVMGGGAAR